MAVEVQLREVLDQFVEPLFRRIRAVAPQHPFKVFRRRVERAAVMLRRTTPFDDGRARIAFPLVRRATLTAVRTARQHLLLQGVNQPGFAETRVADQQHDLAHALDGLLPPLLQQPDFAVATDQRRECPRLGQIDPAAGHPFRFDEMDLLRPPLESLLTETVAVEEPPDQLECVVTDDHRVRFGHRVHLADDVQQRADDRQRAFLTRVLHHRVIAVNRRDRRQIHLVFVPHAVAQRSHLFDQLQPGANGPLRRVFKRDRVTEASPQPVFG